MRPCREERGPKPPSGILSEIGTATYAAEQATGRPGAPASRRFPRPVSCPALCGCRSFHMFTHVHWSCWKRTCMRLLLPLTAAAACRHSAAAEHSGARSCPQRAAEPEAGQGKSLRCHWRLSLDRSCDTCKL